MKPESKPFDGLPPANVEDPKVQEAAPSAEEKAKKNSSLSERVAFSLDEQRREENHRP